MTDQKEIVDKAVAELMNTTYEARERMLTELLTRMISGEQVTLIEHRMADDAVVKYQYKFTDEFLPEIFADTMDSGELSIAWLRSWKRKPRDENRIGSEEQFIRVTEDGQPCAGVFLPIRDWDYIYDGIAMIKIFQEADIIED